jgi:hypothetical protein
MKTIRPAAIALTLALLAGGTAIAQRGRGGPALGQAWGFRGVGLGNWALHENGVDSIAARFQLTEQQRAEFEALAQGFRSENGEVLSRWEQMRDEIQSFGPAAGGIGSIAHTSTEAELQGSRIRGQRRTVGRARRLAHD